ncbi:MAG: ABC transporter ATP-binding protein [Candidatus Taylorbacteria bacterium]|nr:ABC transporter ATP-binding protein [Candidatus Taylorbacteria bacterium]
MNYSTWALIKDLWKYIRPYKWRFIKGTINRIITETMWLYPTYAVAWIINFLYHYSKGDALQSLYIVVGCWIAVALIDGVFMFWGKYYLLQVGVRASLDAESETLRHLFLLDISWHEKENVGKKVKRIEKGGSGIDKLIRIWANNIIDISVNSVGIIFIIAQFNMVIAAIVLVYMISFYMLAGFFRKKGVEMSNIVHIKDEIRGGLIFESMNNIRSTKVMSMIPRLLGLIQTVTNEINLYTKKRIFWFQSGGVVRDMYGQIIKIGISTFIIYGIIHGHYELGFFVLFNNYFTAISRIVRGLADVSEEISVSKQGISRMMKILEEPIMIDDETKKKPFPRDWKKITFANLSFSYGGKNVLEDLSLEIKRGEKIGVVGLSGAGKSTLFKLLLKEHENYSGAIYFDDVALKDVSKKDYFNYLAVVLQDTELFNMSLKDNITITNSRKEKDQTLLDRSISIAHVKEFMKKLPEGVDTIIGEKGVKLSGGEKQRVGIARAVFKNPQILLLDEATSHLDVESEETIQDSLHQFFENVTAIVIAHRLTTIKEMDRIIVLEQGKIIEQGSFTKLRRLKGRFYELWEKQKL